MDLGWTRYQELEELANIRACLHAARKAGNSDEEAESCEGGNLRCPECPWKDCD
jgi:hypothetical protein